MNSARFLVTCMRMSPGIVHVRLHYAISTTPRARFNASAGVWRKHFGCGKVPVAPSVHFDYFVATGFIYQYIL
jgi:hypothetical protein